MSDKKEEVRKQLDLEDEINDDESITDTDYVFILNNQGGVKGILMPSEEAFEVPKSVKKICKNRKKRMKESQREVEKAEDEGRLLKPKKSIKKEKPEHIPLPKTEKFERNKTAPSAISPQVIYELFGEYLNSYDISDDVYNKQFLKLYDKIRKTRGSDRIETLKNTRIVKRVHLEKKPRSEGEGGQYNPNRQRA